MIVRWSAGLNASSFRYGLLLLLLLGWAGSAYSEDGDVVADSAPSLDSVCIPKEIWYREGVAIEPRTFPAATGGDAPLTYILSRPPGLEFDRATRSLSGTPDPLRPGVPKATYFVKYMVIDADGDRDSISLQIVVMAEDYSGRSSGTTIGSSCDVPPKTLTDTFTDSTGRSIKYRLHFKDGWDLSQARGVELYFHGNNSGTEERLLDLHPYFRPDPLSLDAGMLRAAVASPGSYGGGRRSWYPPDARAVHELLQSDFGGNAAVDRDRIVFTGDSQGPCFINYFLQRYAAVYGGGFHSNCGCLFWGGAWPPSTARPWSPTILWTSQMATSVAPRFRVFVQATTEDFLYDHSVRMRKMFADVLGFETRSDLDAQGAHCQPGATEYGTIFEWLSKTPTPPQVYGTVAGDYDADGLADTVDPDDDNDGALDTIDALPHEPREWLDTDGDGIGDFLDSDADGDGVANADDPLPLNPSEGADNDGDGIGDNADTDDDNDGIPDAEDAEPLNGAKNDQLGLRSVGEYGLAPHEGSFSDGKAALRHATKPPSITYPQVSGDSQTYYAISLGDSSNPVFEIMLDSHNGKPCEEVMIPALCTPVDEGGFGFNASFGSHGHFIYIDRNQNGDLTDDGPPLILGDGSRTFYINPAGVSLTLNVPYSSGVRLPYRIVLSNVGETDDPRLVYNVRSYWTGQISVDGANPVLVGTYDANLDGLFNSGVYRFEEAVTITRTTSQDGRPAVSRKVTSPEKLSDLRDYACVDIDRNGELDDCGEFISFEEEDVFSPMFPGETFMLDDRRCLINVSATGHTVQIDCGADTSPSFGSVQAPGDQTYGVDGPIAALTLPVASGGDGALTYSLSPYVPGLTFDAGRRLSGTPTKTGSYSMTYTATDVDGDADSLSFTITVDMADTAPSFAANQNPGDQTYTEGTPIAAFILPEASGGNGALTYSLSPSVPGLAFDAATRGLSGTPTTAGSHNMTYTATDTDGDADSLSFAITVDAADTAPSFAANQNPGDQTYREGTPITTFTLPEANGGNGALTYSLSPVVPGLTFDAATRQFSGTPTGAGSYSMTYTATDEDNDTDALNFSITVGDDHGNNAASATAVAVGSDTPGVLDAGDVDYFAVTVTSAGRLEFYTSGVTDTFGHLENASGTQVASNDDNGTGRNFRISREVATGVWYVRVRGYSGAVSGSYTLHVRSETDASPSFAGSQADLTYTAGTQITTVTLPAASGGDGALTYSLSPSVPGLAFASATRRLSGTPTKTGSYSMTYTAEDADGDTDSLTFTITVNAADTAPSFSGSQSDLTYTAGTPITTFALPAASGGDGVLTYSLSPSVPGLAFAASTRRLSGTPTKTGSYSMTYTAEDTDGDTDSLTFTITVNAADSAPSFSGSQAGLTYTAGTPITAFTLPAATGGDGVLTYSLSPSVPGLAFAASTRRLSGTPTKAGSYSMTYSAEDTDGDTDSLTFTITVNAADSAPSFSGSQAGLTYTAGTPITAFTLPAATGGDGVLTYSLSPSVPGLAFAASTRRLSGTPTKTGSYSMTYTAEDTDGDTDSLTFTITVDAADTAPSFSGSQSDLTYLSGTPITAFALPAATGGDGALTYSLSPSVPGLAFAPSTRRLSGTPTADGAGLVYRMRLLVRDEDGDTDSLRFTITVERDTAPSFAGAAFHEEVILSMGRLIEKWYYSHPPQGVPLPAASGGEGTLTYSLSPTVPGLTFIPSTRRITGTATKVGSYSMTYTAEDADGDTDTLTFKIIVEVDTAPRFSVTQADLTYTVGTPITTLVLPLATGGNDVRYTFYEGAGRGNPAGLTFNYITRELSGTPTEPGTYRMEWHVQDIDNEQDFLRFTITVVSGQR